MKTVSYLDLQDGRLDVGDQVGDNGGGEEEEVRNLGLQEIHCQAEEQEDEQDVGVHGPTGNSLMMLDLYTKNFDIS